jgi:hypothetical protein
VYLFTVLFRLIWSLTIGLPFFAVGLILFLLLEILKPKSAAGFKVLVNMYKWGSGHWFKGLKMETGNYPVEVTKGNGA